MTTVLAYLSPALFLISCACPCLELRMGNGNRDVMLGLRALAIGWSGVFAGIVAWFANPVWLLGVGLSFWNKPWPAAVAGVVSVLIGLTTRSVLGRELPADEGNVNKMIVVRVLPGFFVWIASLVLLVVTSLLQIAQVA